MAWQKICAVEDIPREGGRTLHLDNREQGTLEIGLFRLGDGTLHAVDNRCPHQQGPLSLGLISGEWVICPLHNRRVHVIEGHMLAPDTGCVKVYPVKVEDQHVYISL